MSWSTDDIETLKRVASEGGSFTDAAALIGKTRDAVAGKAYRLGVPFACDPALVRAKVRAGCKQRWDSYTPKQKKARLDATVHKRWAGR